MAANIKDLHIILQDKAAQFIKACAAKNIQVGITQGFRTTEYQNQLYAQGRTKPGRIVTNCRGGYSPHNYGLAFDFCIYENGKVDWDSRNKKWAIAGAIGESLGLEWGGRWIQFVDMPHLQFMFDLTIAQLRNGKRPPIVVKVPEVRWLKELEEKYLERVGKDIYCTLQRLTTPAELAGLKENQLVRINKSIYRKLN
jgi:peptidoglycan L-alanyl-D-glutamate endopeptidase CwlK